MVGSIIRHMILKKILNRRAIPDFYRVAFVFTSGEWNKTIMQDPEHYYSGEEFALTLRSYTHGYDLFTPDEIVVWHRCHSRSKS